MTNHKFTIVKKHGIVFCNTLAQANKHYKARDKKYGMYLVPDYDQETFILCLELNRPLTLWEV